MSRARRGLLALVLLALGVWAAYRMIAITQADRWADRNPALALQWLQQARVGDYPSFKPLI